MMHKTCSKVMASQACLPQRRNYKMEFGAPALVWMPSLPPHTWTKVWPWSLTFRI